MQVVHDDETDRDQSGDSEQSEHDESEQYSEHDISQIAAAKYFSADENTKDALLLVFGVLLPILAIVFESAFHFCARYYFDPFPSTSHIILFSLIPLSNLMAWMTRRSNLSSHYAFMSLSSGMAMGVALMYALMFLPITGPATFSVVYLGFGLLGLSPLISLPCLWWSGKRVCHLADEKKTYFEAHQVKHFGHIIVLVMVLAVELPSTLTRMNLALAVDEQTEAQGLDFLRKYGSEEVLLRACYERSGRATDIVGSLYEHQHPIKIEDARRVFYKVTGKPFNSVPIPASARSTIQHGMVANDPAGLNAVVQDEFDLDADVAGEQVSGVVRGLEAAQSAMNVRLDADALFANVDWSFQFANQSKYDREARGKIALPPGAVVTKATLVINGVEHDATIMVREAARAYYQEAVKQHKEDPLLVSMCGPDQVLVQCFPVHPGAKMQVNLHIVAPMPMGVDDKTAFLDLPTFVERNFSIGDSSKLSVESKSKYEVFGGTRNGEIDNSKLSSFSGVIKAERDPQITALAFRDTFAAQAADARMSIAREKLNAPTELTVVIDGSVSLKQQMPQIAQALKMIPATVPVKMVLVQDGAKWILEAPARSNTELFAKAISTLEKSAGVGGQDNSDVLSQALRELYRVPGSAVLWIHGAQPISRFGSASISAVLQMNTVLRQLSSPLLYDLQVAPGPVEILSGLTEGRRIRHLTRTGTVAGDIELLTKSWVSAGAASTDAGQTEYVKPVLPSLGSNLPVITSSVSPSSTSVNVVASGEAGLPPDMAGVKQVDSSFAQLAAYKRLMRELQLSRRGGLWNANQLARTYHLVTPVSSAVVVDEIQELNKISVPPPQPVPVSDPVLDAKNLMDASFDGVDQLMANIKYEFVDIELNRILSGSPLQLDLGEALTRFLNSVIAIPNSNVVIVNQLNRLNRVTPESYSGVSNGSPGVSIEGSSGMTDDLSNSQPPVVSRKSDQVYPSDPAFPQAKMIELMRKDALRGEKPLMRPILAWAGKESRYSAQYQEPVLPSLQQRAEGQLRQKPASAPAPVRELDSPDTGSAASGPGGGADGNGYGGASGDQFQYATGGSVNGPVKTLGGTTALPAAKPVDGDGYSGSLKGRSDGTIQEAEKRAYDEENFNVAENKLKESTRDYKRSELSSPVSELQKNEQVSDFRRSNQFFGAKKQMMAQSALQSLPQDKYSYSSTNAESDVQVISGVNTAGTVRSSMLRSEENTKASKLLTLVSLLCAALMAAIAWERALTKNTWVYVRSALLLLAMSPVFYVLLSFLVPHLEPWMK